MEFRKEIANKIADLEKELVKYDERLDNLMQNHDIEEDGIECAIYSLSEKITYIKEEIEELKNIFWDLGFVKIV